MAVPKKYRDKALEHNSYRGMLERARNPNRVDAHRYFERNITVCDRWLGPNGFTNFLADMGPRPSHKHSIDRKNNNLGYSPENCRWATKKEQVANREPKNKPHKKLVSMGENKSIKELSKELNMSEECLRTRLKRGWDLNKIKTKQKAKHKFSLKEIKLMVNRHLKGASTIDAAKSIGAHPQTYYRLAKKLKGEKNEAVR